MINGGDGWAEEERSHTIQLWELFARVWPDFQTCKECAISSQSSMCCVCSKRNPPRKKTSHTPLHVIWAISLFKSVKIKKGGHTAHPAHQFWQLFHFWKMSKSIWAEWAWNKRSFFSGKISFLGVQGLGSRRITINGASLCTFYESCQGSSKVSFATIAARLSQNQETRS